MKAILMSIKPQHVAKILNGEKTLEIRKTIPQEYLDYCIDSDKKVPIDVYIYCTKKEPYARRYVHNDKWGTLEYIKSDGKVVAKFTLNKVGNFLKEVFGTYEEPFSRDQDELLKKSCLTEKELDNYLKGKKGYAWHIDNLVVFEKPKEISEFYKPSWAKVRYKTMREEQAKQYLLTRAPESWCYIEV